MSDRSTLFLSELKNRKIGQTAAVYLGSTWVLTEAFSFFTERYNWNSNLFNVFAISGLPAVLITRWYQDAVTGIESGV